jgi:hypothetical protein
MAETDALWNGIMHARNLKALRLSYEAEEQSNISMESAASGATDDGNAGSAGSDSMGGQATLPLIPYPPRSRARYVVKRMLRVFSSPVKLQAYGSSVNGFGDNSSDVDVVLVIDDASLVDALGLRGVSGRDLAVGVLKKLQGPLQKQGFQIKEFVSNAMVPILKMCLRLRHEGAIMECECDLSVNNVLPMFNTKLLKAYSDIDHRVVALTQACKSWARARDVHGARDGHLSSYAFTLMAIFYMQVRGALPCLQKCAEEKPLYYDEGSKAYNVSINDSFDSSSIPQTSGIDFSDFLRFFVEEFKWGEWVVSVRTGQCLPLSAYPLLRKPRHHFDTAAWKKFIHIEDPFEIERNLNCVLTAESNAKLQEEMHTASSRSRESPECEGDVRKKSVSISEDIFKLWEEMQKASSRSPEETPECLPEPAECRGDLLGRAAPDVPRSTGRFRRQASACNSECSDDAVGRAAADASRCSRHFRVRFEGGHGAWRKPVIEWLDDSTVSPR